MPWQQPQQQVQQPQASLMQQQAQHQQPSLAMSMQQGNAAGYLNQVGPQRFSNNQLHCAQAH